MRLLGGELKVLSETYTFVSMRVRQNNGGTDDDFK